MLSEGKNSKEKTARGPCRYRSAFKSKATIAIPAAISVVRRLRRGSFSRTMVISQTIRAIMATTAAKQKTSKVNQPKPSMLGSTHFREMFLAGDELG